MKKYNLLLPIAGRAQRFINAGYTIPKPLIMVKTEPVIDWSLKSIDVSECQLIFVVLKEHVLNFAIDKILIKKFGNDIKIVVLNQITSGALETCYLAKEYINENPLIIYTPDVYFEPKFNPSILGQDMDGFILTFKANNPAHSYVLIDDHGFATKTAEKEVISNNAAVGVYAFNNGLKFVEIAENYLKNGTRTNNEYYICPIYNQLIEGGGKVKINQIEKLHVLGTPEELEWFVSNVINKFGEKPIALCSDHSGIKLKEMTKKALSMYGIKFIDYGCYTEKDCDHHNYVKLAAKSIQDKICDFGMGFCRSGQAINIESNHFSKIRCALIMDDYMAEFAVRHNNANFFALSEKYVNEDVLYKIIAKLQNVSFDGGRFFERVCKD